MDFYKKRVMISRQGKAINHLHPSYFANPIKRPPIREVEKNDNDFDSILLDIEKIRKKEEENNQHPGSVKLSCSFTSISREKYEYTTRNRTESPRVGHYNPNWQAVRPRSAQAPRIKRKQTKAREKNIFTPLCITGDLSCNFPNRNSAAETELGIYNEKLKRTMSNFNNYIEKVEEKHKMKCKNESLTNTVQSFVSFDKQLDRREFVSSKDPPNAKRFSFIGTNSQNYSKNKHIRTYLFSKSTPRSALFETKLTVGPYKKDEEKLMPKLNNTQVSMSKMTDRKELLLEHMLDTPKSIELNAYDKAFFKQSTIRGAYKIPLMSTATPRDDIMYRTTEAYCLNVPEIQSAEAKPKYMAESSLKQSFINSLN